MPAEFAKLDSPSKAWERRVQSGQAGGQMLNSINNMGKDRALAMFGDWTSRIAAGELPQAPARPQGVERNVVITQWDWRLLPTCDEIATDKQTHRQPNGFSTERRAIRDNIPSSIP
jgi:hypothetical protein